MPASLPVLVWKVLHRPWSMPAARPSTPVSTRSMSTRLASCWALIFPASSGAVAFEYVTLLMTFGLAFTYSSIMPWVSCRLPATSRMLRLTGALGVSGTAPALSGVLPAGLSGAPQAATSARVASRTVARFGRNMADSLLALGIRWSGAVADHQVGLELA